MKLTNEDFAILEDHECGWKGKAWNLMLNYDSEKECEDIIQQILSNQEFCDTVFKLLISDKPGEEGIITNLKRVIEKAEKIPHSVEYYNQLEKRVLEIDIINDSLKQENKALKEDNERIAMDNAILSDFKTDVEAQVYMIGADNLDDLDCKYHDLKEIVEKINNHISERQSHWDKISIEEMKDAPKGVCVSIPSDYARFEIQQLKGLLDTKEEK